MPFKKNNHTFYIICLKIGKFNKKFLSKFTLKKKYILEIEM